MKKFLLIPALTGLVSLASFAAPSQPDFSLLSDTQKMMKDHKDVGKCLRKGWEAAKPTEEQNQKAGEIVGNVGGIVGQHKAAIKEGFRNMFLAYAKHPVSRDEVVAVEGALITHLMPVKDAIRDAQIDLLNLLNIDQREDFDRAVIDCFHKSGSF